MFSTTPVAGMLAVVLLGIGHGPGALLDAVFHVPDNPWLVFVKFSLLALCLVLVFTMVTFLTVLWWLRKCDQRARQYPDHHGCAERNE